MNKFALAVLLGLGFPTFAQTPFLVRDINSTRSDTARSSSPSDFVADGSTLYFAATRESSGTELWKVEGGQETPVADLVAGSGSSSPRWIARLRDGAIVFSAFTPASGRELWITNGTPEGTLLVKNIHPTGNANPGVRAVVNGKVFFTAADGVNGEEPWVSDGTEAGTRMLVNLDGTASSTTVPVLAPFGERVLIFARGGMWSTDGTPEGTVSIVPSATLGSVQGFATIGATAYFTATAELGRELWKTDGTLAGTMRVKDIAAGTASGITGAPQLVARGGFVYFIGSETGSTFDLWRSDGTDAGTQKVKGGVATGSSTSLFDGGTLLYLSTNNGLWRSDGTTNGTLVVEPDAGVLWPTVAFGGLYYVKIAGSISELWATNGSTPRRIHSFSNAPSFYPSLLRFTGGKLYFAMADLLHGSEPWVCADADGTVVDMLANVNPDGPPSSSVEGLTAAGDLVFFTADDGLGLFRGELWRSDGTVAGTFRVTSLGDASNSPWISLFTAWRGALYFKDQYTRLFRSDGTEAGTVLVKDIRLGFNTPSIEQLFPATDYLYMDADEGPGPSLMRTDGTAAGTIDIAADKIDYVDSVVELAGRVYANGGLHDPGIVATRGTPESTKRVVSFPSSEDSTTPLVAAAGRLFFGRSTTAAGVELWSSDGTTEGTALVTDLVAGTGSSSPQQLTGGARFLFFVADDGTHGQEVWRTDGTAEGTILLRDIAAGAPSSSPSGLTMNGEVLFFVADDGIAGAELWRSDGTPAGTVMVADILPGAGSSLVQNLYASDGTLWFSASDDAHGMELWRTNAAGGVEMVADLEPGPASSWPRSVVRAGRLLYFNPLTSAFGRELWALDLGSQPAVSIADARVVEGNGGTVAARFVLTRTGDVAAPSTVTFTTADLSATAGVDYVATAGSVTFGAGATTQFVDVLVNGDTSIEKNEAFLVTLTGATGAVLRDASGVAVIEEDDRRAELTLEYLNHYEGSDSVRITNNGPSMATEIVVKLSHSPGKKSLCGSGTANPADCAVGNLAAGQSTTVSLSASSDLGTFMDPTTGTTVTAEVRAAEADTNLGDNFVSRLVGANMVLPPFLTNNTIYEAFYDTHSVMGRDTIATIRSSSASVIVSPSSVTIPSGQTRGAFTLWPRNFVGVVEINGWWFGDTGTLSIASVHPGQTAKLDAGVYAPTVSVVYGNPVNVVVEIAARRHDGTRPTGTVTLVDETGATLGQQALNGQASATFVRNDVAPGNRVWRIQYSGDANFNPLANAPVAVSVSGMPTTTTLEIPPYFCGTADIVIRVRNTASTALPEGNVKFTVSGAEVILQLAPSGVPGEGFATLQRTFTTGQAYVSAQFQPASSTFGWSSASKWVQAVNCAAFNLVAAADGPTITAQWTAQPGADRYDLMYMYNSTNWVLAVSTQGTSASYTTAYDAKVLLVAVRALDAAGNVLSYSPADIVCTKRFTDDPFVAGASRARSLHITELQAMASSLRFLVDSGSVELPAAIAGAPIRAARILELREAINKYRLRLGLPPFSFTDPSLAAGQSLKAAHVQELRNALK